MANRSRGRSRSESDGDAGDSLKPLVVLVLLGVFFVAFNVLEALLPSLVSRFAPAQGRGAAAAAPGAAGKTA